MRNFDGEAWADRVANSQWWQRTPTDKWLHRHNEGSLDEIWRNPLELGEWVETVNKASVNEYLAFYACHFREPN